MKKLLNNSPLALSVLGIFLFVLVLSLFIRSYQSWQYPEGREMLGLIEDQLELGERNVGSVGHVKTREFITSQLQQAGLRYQEQSWVDSGGQKLVNIIGRINPGQSKRVIVGTHYDTKAGIPGANDGASGVAVLLQLAKELRTEYIGVDLVFFDAEEFEPGPFTDWKPKGSTYFGDNLSLLYPNEKPEFAIVPDMVCKKDLVLKREEGSVKNAPVITNSLWESARYFIDEHTFSEEKNG